MTQYLTTRKEAIVQKVPHYYTGTPCHKGHVELRYTRSGACKKCSAEKASLAYKNGTRTNPEARIKAMKNWNAKPSTKEAKQKWKENNPKRAWAVYATGAAKQRAALKNIPFDLTFTDILTICPDVCPVFNTPFVFIGNKKPTLTSATIDKIDPNLGYIKGNIAIISMKANAIKSNATHQEIFKVAKWLEKWTQYVD